jgi:uncharacterized RDD family membrane protein YckC
MPEKQRPEDKIVLAASVKRLFAFIVDYSIIALLLMGVHPLFLPNDWDLLPYNQVLISIFPVYFLGILLLIFKDSFGGVSLGKGLLNLQITLVDESFSRPSTGQLILRNLLIVLLPIELYLLLMDKHGRRLGDKYAGTMVIDHLRPPAIRNLTTKLIAVMLVLSILWMAFTFCTPVAIKSSSGYRISEQAVLKSSTVNRITGEIKSIGYWPEVSYKKDSTVYRIKVVGELEERTVQVILSSNIASAEKPDLPEIESLIVLK